MATRKTINRGTVINCANAFLLHSEDSLVSDRQAVHMVTANMLHAAGCYKGFQYLRPEHMAESLNGKTCGILFDESGNSQHVYPDSSRVYFI